MIRTEEDLSEPEAVAFRAVHERLQTLLNGKLLSYALPIGSRTPADIVTPAIVRAMVRQGVEHLLTADELEAFIVRCIELNGHRFEAWEADPSVIRAAP